MIDYTREGGAWRLGDPPRPRRVYTHRGKRFARGPPLGTELQSTPSCSREPRCGASFPKNYDYAGPRRSSLASPCPPGPFDIISKPSPTRYTHKWAQTCLTAQVQYNQGSCLGPSKNDALIPGPMVSIVKARTKEHASAIAPYRRATLLTGHPPNHISF